MALGTLAASAAGGDVLRSVVAGAAQGVQVLSLTLAFGGASILMVVANVGGCVAGLLAVVGRLVELPANRHRAHA